MKINSSAKPVQSLGREVYQGAPESLVGAGLNLAGGVLQGVAKARGQVIERQKQQAGLLMQKRESGIKEANSGKEFYNYDEIPEEFRTEGMEVKGRVMSSEIFPSIYSSEMSSALEDASLIIEEESARKDWIEEARSVLSSKGSKIQSEANKAISAQILSDQSFNYNNAMKSGYPDMAKSIVSDMSISDSEKEGLILKADKEIETNMYSDFMSQSDISGIDQSIENLSSKNYSEGGGSLNPDEKVLWQHKLRSEKVRIENTNSAGVNAGKKLITKEVQVVTSNLLKGNASNPDALMDLASRAKAIGASPALIEDMTSAFVFATTNDFQNKEPANKRIAGIDGLVNSTGLPQFRKDQLRQRLEDSNIAQSNMERSDLMQAASNAGFIDLTPLDATDPRTFAVQLTNRIAQMSMVEENYQMFNGEPITNMEAESFSGLLNSMNARDQIPYLVAISQVLGEEAVGFFQQLSTDGSSTSMSIAGITAIKGTPNQAEAILMGNEYRKQNKDEMPEIRRNLEPEIAGYASAFQTNFGMWKAIKDATTDAYIFYSIQSGNSPSVFDQSTFDKAVNAATGGIVSYGSQNLQAPAYGVTDDTFDSWIYNLSAEYIDQLGGIDGMNSETFTRTLRQGNFKLVGYKQGEYYVTRNNDIHLGNASKGGAFLLKYDPSAKRRDNSRRGRRGRRR